MVIYNNTQSLLNYFKNYNFYNANINFNNHEQINNNKNNKNLENL